MHRQGSRTAENIALRKDAGKFLKTLRKHAGLTQRDVSEALGYRNYTMVSQQEAGSARVPPQSYAALAKVLGVDTAKFVQKLLQFYDPHTYAALWGEKRIDLLDLIIASK